VSDEGSVLQETLHVLVVEDDAINRTLAATMLTLLGCTVSTASSGTDAFNIALSSEFDLIFMDCQMPGVDGFEATRMIRENQRDNRAFVPIIALTANTNDEDRERCLRAGMNDFVSKPFRKETLRAAIGRAKPRTNSSQASAQSTPISDRPGETDAKSVQQLDGTTTSDDANTIDLKAIEDIAALENLGNPGLLENALNMYIATSFTELQYLRQSLESGNLTLARSVAHKLKGSSRAAGAVHVGAILATIERVCLEPSHESALRAVVELEQAHQKAIHALAGIIETRRGSRHAA